MHYLTYKNTAIVLALSTIVFATFQNPGGFGVGFMAFLSWCASVHEEW